MRVFRTLSALGLIGTLAACQSTSTPMNSSNVYRTSETNRAMSVAACTVTQARYVSLVDDSQAGDGKDTINQGIGVVAGALIGHAIGSEIGAGDGNTLAKQLGTIAGGVAGSNVADNVNANRRTMTGVEYTVNLGDKGHRTIVQSLNAGEAPIPTGSKCTVTGSGKTLRVLPM